MRRAMQWYNEAPDFNLSNWHGYEIPPFRGHPHPQSPSKDLNNDNQHSTALQPEDSARDEHLEMSRGEHLGMCDTTAQKFDAIMQSSDTEVLAESLEQVEVGTPRPGRKLRKSVEEPMLYAVRISGSIYS